MKIIKGADIELRVEKLAFGGKAVAKVDGFVVFMDRAIPGQTVKALITRKKRNYAEARVIETLTQSPDYRSPVCPHFGICGGCHWQDISYEAQLFWKRTHVVECLQHIAGAGETEVGRLLPPPKSCTIEIKWSLPFPTGVGFWPKNLTGNSHGSPFSRSAFT